jgi:hypothetical protein
MRSGATGSQQQVLIEEYKKWATQHGVGTMSGDSKATNASYKKMMATLAEMKGHHPSAPIELMKLLNDPNPSVASWAATHLINFCESDSLLTLERIAKSDSGLIAFDAKMVLEERRNGRFKGETW